jgi:hypothetical protein
MTCKFAETLYSQNCSEFSGFVRFVRRDSTFFLWRLRQCPCFRRFILCLILPSAPKLDVETKDEANEEVVEEKSLLNFHYKILYANLGE